MIESDQFLLATEEPQCEFRESDLYHIEDDSVFLIEIPTDTFTGIEFGLFPATEKSSRQNSTPKTYPISQASPRMMGPVMRLRQLI